MFVQHILIFLQNKEEHIKKKLQVLKDSWNANKLSDDIKKQIFELTKGINYKFACFQKPCAIHT